MLLLGVNQALCWSMTVIMMVDLVGPKRRGLALGLNELRVTSPWQMPGSRGHPASIYALPQPFSPGHRRSVPGSLLSLVFTKETRHYATLEATLHPKPGASTRGRRKYSKAALPAYDIFALIFLEKTEPVFLQPSGDW